MKLPENVKARIKELRAKEKSNSLTEAEKAELAELAIKYPKKQPKPGNDFSYHNKYPELMAAVTNYPWMHIAGTKVVISDRGEKTRVGNVLSVKYIMSIGKSLFTTDAFNLSSRDQWLNMHRKYRGMGTYQQADYGIVRLCNMSVFVELGEAERIYGICHGYPIKNRITPRGLLLAMGFSSLFVDNLEVGLAAYRATLNRIITKAQRLCLPKGISALYNWMGLSSFLYADSKDNPERAATIVFQRAGSWVYDARSFKTGSAAKFVPYTPSSFNHPTQYLQTIEDHIDKLLNDDDVTRICSDVIACFDNASLEALSIMPEDYAVTVKYDASILLKLHNAEILEAKDMVTPYLSSEIDPIEFDNNFAYIHQRDNTIIFEPSFVHHSSKALGTLLSGENMWVNKIADFPVYDVKLEIVANKSLLDTWEANPSDATRCEAVLWKPNYFVTEVSSAPQGTAITLSSSATEILLDCKAITVSDGSLLESATYASVIRDSETVGTAAKVLCMASQVDWAPLVYVKYADPVTPNNVKFIFGDLDNYTVFDKALAPMIFDIATLSDFKVDMVFNNKA